jgi:hypothetical protein
MSLENPKYGVAISFLAKDEPIAAALDHKLRESFDVFFFPKKQEDLAGTDGMESMRTPFLEDCRVMVVLYREGWGKTRWTAIEETAVKDACFNGGWKRLFFIALDRTSALPKWLPEYHVRFNWEDFGLEEAVGAIKARVLENGGKRTPLTPLRKAELLREEEEFRSAKSNMNSFAGLKEIGMQVQGLFAEIERQCTAISESVNASIRWECAFRPGTQQSNCHMSDHTVGLAVIWHQQFGNLLDNSGLIVKEFIGNLLMPSEFHLMQLRKPTEINEILYAPHLSRSGEYGWKLAEKEGFISSTTLGERCVSRFLDLIQRYKYENR